MSMNKFIIKEKQKLICFEPIRHKYFFNETEFISVNKLMESFIPKFDEDGSITERCAVKEGLSIDEIKQKWDDNKNKACEFGTRLHSYAERKLWNIDASPLNISDLDFGLAIDNFINDTNLNMIDTESIIFSEMYGVSGTADILLSKDDLITIGDWKTNAKDILDNDDSYGKMMLNELSHLKNTTFNHYALQLSIYAYMLEDWGLKVSKLKIFHIRKTSVDVFEVPYLKDEARIVLESNLKREGFMPL